MAVRFTIKGNPMGKPRMTVRDRWQVRPSVAKYRLWADRARLAAPKGLTLEPEALDALAYLSMPPSWSRSKRERMAGQPHRVKPDADNILKAICDSLFPNDSMIYDKRIRKFWEDGRGARLEVSVI